MAQQEITPAAEAKFFAGVRGEANQ